jgi:hypothetical protein
MSRLLIHFRKTTSVLLTLVLLACHGGAQGWGQILEAEVAPGAARLGKARTARYRVGIRIDAKRGAVQKIRAMVAVPLPCDLQQAQIVDEDISDQIDKATYRDLPGGGARQLLIQINHLPAGEKAHAIVTFEVQTHSVLPPTETEMLTIPQRPPRSIKQYLGISPFIETKHRKIRDAVKEAFARLESGEESGEQQAKSEKRLVE